MRSNYSFFFFWQVSCRSPFSMTRYFIFGHVECSACRPMQRFLYSCKPPVKYEIKRQFLRVNDLLWMLRLSPLCLDWNAICFLYEKVKKKKEKEHNGEQEVSGLLECKCAPGLRFCTLLSVAIMGKKSHRCDSFRETWHLEDNRSVFLQLFNFSAVWNPLTLIQRLSELQSRPRPVLWQGFADRRKKKLWNMSIW